MKNQDKKMENKPIAKMGLFIDYAPLPNCKSPEETYGEICIQCNKCGRFNKVTAKPKKGDER